MLNWMHERCDRFHCDIGLNPRVGRVYSASRRRTLASVEQSSAMQSPEVVGCAVAFDRLAENFSGVLYVGIMTETRGRFEKSSESRRISACRCRYGVVGLDPLLVPGGGFVPRPHPHHAAGNASAVSASGADVGIAVEIQSLSNNGLGCVFGRPMLQIMHSGLARCADVGIAVEIPVAVEQRILDRVLRPPCCR